MFTGFLLLSSYILQKFLEFNYGKMFGRGMSRENKSPGTDPDRTGKNLIHLPKFIPKSPSLLILSLSLLLPGHQPMHQIGKPTISFYVCTCKSAYAKQLVFDLES